MSLQLRTSPWEILKINGIVYNEVKNGLSDPEWRLHLAISGGLLPDTPYARNGAGDSLVMPDLTYEQFKAYHQSYYHPSNCYVFFYGNIPTCEYLEFLADRLAAIPRTETKEFLQPSPTGNHTSAEMEIAAACEG